MSKIRVGLADGDIMYRQGIALQLEKSGKFFVPFDVDTTREAGKLLPKKSIHVLIVALEPAFYAQMQQIEKIKIKYPDLKIIVFTSTCTFQEREELYKCNINGMILKLGSIERLIDAIEKVKNNGCFFDDPEIEIIIKQTKKETDLFNLWSKVELTAREEEVFVLVCNEFSNKQIADRLRIDEGTVETHRKHINTKINSNNVCGWVMFAYNMGWIKPVNKDLINIKNLHPPQVPLINDFKAFWGWFY